MCLTALNPVGGSDGFFFSGTRDSFRDSDDGQVGFPPESHHNKELRTTSARPTRCRGVSPSEGHIGLCCITSPALGQPGFRDSNT